MMQIVYEIMHTTRAWDMQVWAKFRSQYGRSYDVKRPDLRLSQIEEFKLKNKI